MPASAESVRLRTSPNFVLAFAMDGRAYVAKETEPYIQYWLADRYRQLHSLFAGRRGAVIGDAIDQYIRLTRTPRSSAGRSRLRCAIEDMRRAGVLISAGDDTSRYDSRIVGDYVAHRPFPRDLATFLVSKASIGASSRVLDLAGGPGDLALALARVSQDVSLMDLSRGFLRAARRRAAAHGVSLTTIHESCNRLVYRDDQYDVITVAQALHWLDDVLVTRGVCRLLKSGGSFFVILSSIDVPDTHPMATILGRHSILGHKTTASFADDVAPLQRRLSLLFDALDAPDVHRVDPAQRWTAVGGEAERIVLAGTTLFRQRRPFGLGYVRGFVTDEHIRPTGLSPAAVWAGLERRAAAAHEADFLGTHHWAVLHFQRGGRRVSPDVTALNALDIAFEGPGECAGLRRPLRRASAGA